MNDLALAHIEINFSPALSDIQADEQELDLIRQFLPELLKEMIWQKSDMEI